MPKFEFVDGKMKAVYDDNNAKDMKQKMVKEKTHLTMSKPDLVKLVKLLISDDEQ